MGIVYANSIYQESFAGTPASNLFYPIVAKGYELVIGAGAFNDGAEKETSWVSVIARIGIIAGALLYGKWNKKSALLLLDSVVKYTALL